MNCPEELRYETKENMLKLSAWDKLAPEIRAATIHELPFMVDAVKILEEKPALPYKYPYTIKSANPITCNKYPTLPVSVTIPMMKQQLNEIAKAAGVDQPFPDYTMYYIILIVLIVVVAMVIMYKMSAKSNSSYMSTNSVYSPNNNGISEYY